MFEDITGDKNKEITLVINNKEFTAKAYDINMNAGNVTGFIKDSDLVVDKYTRYMVTIPISIKESILLTEDGYNWSFPVIIKRVNPNTLKFYTPWV